MKRLSSIAAATVALAFSLSVFAGGPGPGDPGTPGNNLPGSSISVSSNGTGVTIYIGIADSSGGSSGNPGGGGGGADYSTWSCTSDLMSIGQASLDWFLKEAPLHPGEAPWVVRCNDQFIGIVWLAVSVGPADIQIVVGAATPVDPVTVATQLLDHVPVPNITVGVNPQVGLAAVPAWFWVDGYNGSPILASDTLGGVTVEVEITPTGYVWKFGDGATLRTTSLGQPYPSTSDIQHTYEQSSLSAGGAFAVTIEVAFSARYRVNGGAWQPLEPISRSFAAPYPVQQLQSILTGG
jgi:hypothetical protein